MKKASYIFLPFLITNILFSQVSDWTKTESTWEFVSVLDSSSWPQFNAVDQYGRIWIGDYNDDMRILNSDGSMFAQIDSIFVPTAVGGATVLAAKYTRGMSIAASGNILFAQSGALVEIDINSVTPTPGTVTAIAANFLNLDDGGSFSPMGPAVDLEGYIYIGRVVGVNPIWVIDPTTFDVIQMIDLEAAPLYSRGMAVDADGTIFIGDLSAGGPLKMWTTNDWITWAYTDSVFNDAAGDSIFKDQRVCMHWGVDGTLWVSVDDYNDNTDPTHNNMTVLNFDTREYFYLVMPEHDDPFSPYYGRGPRGVAFNAFAQQAYIISPNAGLTYIYEQVAYPGIPKIVITPDSLDFGDVALGYPDTLSVQVRNLGLEPLHVSLITISGTGFSAATDTFSLTYQQSRMIDVVLSISDAQTYTGSLTITSNDPDYPVIAVPMRGNGVLPPEITVAPDSIISDVYTGAIDTHIVTIGNTGAGVLHWEMVPLHAENAAPVAVSPVFSSGTITEKEESPLLHPQRPEQMNIFSFESILYPSALMAEPHSSSFLDTTINPYAAAIADDWSDLETILGNLDASYSAITSVIPSRYDFSDGVTDYYISDGGNDMYDGGNYLGTNFGGWINYSDGKITNSSYLGSGGRYFTRKYPGLFVMAADMEGVSHFEIWGDLGADGVGSVDGAVLQTTLYGQTYYGFVKRVYNAGDPSVNHLIITSSPEANQDFSNYTNDDYHRVFNLSGSTRIYYLLYAGSNGAYIDNDATLTIMNVFLSAMKLVPDWVTFTPDSGTVIPGGDAEVQVVLNAGNLPGGDYRANLLVASNDFQDPEHIIPIQLGVTGAPDIFTEADSLQFGQVFMQDTVTYELIVENRGTADLLITNVVAEPSQYTVSPAFAGVDPGEFDVFQVTFMPIAVADYSGTLTFTTNDPDEAAYVLPLSGQGVLPPILTFAPDSMYASLFTGEDTLQYLTLNNPGGGSDLIFDIELEGVGFGSVTFTKDNYADWTDPANQDRITDEVWLTRADSRGLFNAAQESYHEFNSPYGTEWAQGYTADLSPEDYRPWREAVYPPRDIAGKAMSLHLISDDLYFDVVFHDWTCCGQGGGFSYTRTDVVPRWMVATPDSGGIAPDSSLDITVAMNAAGLFGGDYSGNIVLRTNDPLAKENRIPVHMDVTGASDINLVIARYDETSMVHYTSSGAVTHHTFADLYNSISDGQLIIAIDGDYNSSSEYADVFLDGDSIGTINPSSTGISVRYFTIPQADFSNYLLDGTLAVTLVNSYSVGTGYGDFHSVRLTYSGESDTLRFDEAFIDYAATRPVAIENTGTDVLTISDMASDNPVFTIDTPSLTIPYGETDTIMVMFLPTVVGLQTGTMTILSNDPDEGTVLLPVSGVGLEPPVITLAPDSINVGLFTGEVDSHVVTISNIGGGSNLVYEIDLEGVGLGTVTFTKDDYADWSDPASQDRITDNVWLTRASQYGLFNAAVETGYDNNSPYDTEWALGYTADLSPTDYRPWRDAVYPPRYIAGKPISLHLISDDLYFDMVFHNWTCCGQGGGFSYTRTDVFPRWMVATPDSGVIAADSTLDVTAVIDAANMYGGDYYADLVVWSNDPATPENRIPVSLHVTGAPDIAVSFAEFDSTSTIIWTEYMATTTHTFHTPFSSAGDGELIVSLAGDFDSSSEYADIYIDGDYVGTVNPTTTSASQYSIEIPMSDLNAYIEDGSVIVDVSNSSSVDPWGSDYHSVRLVYTGSLDSLDFGMAYVNYEVQRDMTIRNVGTDMLSISSITVDSDTFTVASSSQSINYGEELTLPVTFLPLSAGIYTATITILSNDPDEGTCEIPAMGMAAEPPVIVVSPDSLFGDLALGDTLHRTLTISNAGASDLSFDISTDFQTIGGGTHALQFDGTDDYVEIPDDASLQLSSQLTLEAWINFESGGTGQPRLISKGPDGQGFELLTEGIGSSRNIVLRIAPGWVGSNTQLSAGEWYHVAATYDGSQIVLYVNGEEDISEGHSGPLNVSPHNLFIGQRSEGSYDRYKGSMDEVRIWNVARTRDQIRADMHREIPGTEPGLVGYWRLNEGIGKLAYDMSANGNPGVIHGTAAWIISTAPVSTWLSVAPTAGRIVPGSNMDVEFILDATGLSVGDFYADCVIASNDPANGIQRVPVTLIAILGLNADLGIPESFALHQNYPNPFNPSTILKFDLPTATQARIVVYNLLGREVVRLANRQMPAGFHQVTWQGRDAYGREVPSGMYLVLMETPEYSHSIKMIMLK
jgi:hypothetical protein